MAKKNKNKKIVHADSIDVDTENKQNESEDLKSKKQKYIEEYNDHDESSKTPFYARYRIPILSSIYKVKNNFYSTNKKKFFTYISLLIFAFFISVTLIVVGGLWLGGAFGDNPADSELGFVPGIVMAIGASILVVM